MSETESDWWARYFEAHRQPKTKEDLEWEAKLRAAREAGIDVSAHGCVWVDEETYIYPPKEQP